MLRINWSRDKVGFVTAYLLIGIVSATVIATLVLLVLGIVDGDWSKYLVPVKFVLAGGYLLGMVAVITRICIYRLKVIRDREQQQGAAGEHPSQGSDHAES